MVLHGMHGIAWNARYCIVLHGIAWYLMVLHGSAWYCMVLHGIKWYCIVSMPKKAKSFQNAFQKSLFQVASAP